MRDRDGRRVDEQDEIEERYLTAESLNLRTHEFRVALSNR
jgi:hypothetical protein